MKSIFLIAAIALLCAAPSRAQEITATGAWQGNLNIFGSSMRLTLRVSQDDKGALSGTISSPDMGIGGMDVSGVKLKKTTLKFDIPQYNGSFEGKISEDGQSIIGSWYVGEQELPITFRRLAAAPTPVPGAPHGVRAVGPEPAANPNSPGNSMSPPTSVAPKISVVEELWTGTYQTPSGAKLKMQLHISHDTSGAVSVKMDSVNEGVNGIRTANASLTDSKLHFEIPQADITYTGTLNATQDEMTGPFSRSGGAQPLTFTRSGAAAPKSPETRAQQAPPAAPAAAAQTSNGIQGTWLGTIEAPGGIKLRIQLHIERDSSGALAVKMDSLDQNANGIPVPKATLTDSAFHFEIPAGGIIYDGTLNAAKGEMAGTFSQGGSATPLNFKRLDQPAPEPKRPQDPVEPYPYISEDVSYVNPKATQVTLAGTLTLPRGAGPFPVAILICGSGAHDRDEALLGHRPFLVISDYLTRHGIAVLRYDKRGVAKSTGNYALATGEDFASDAEAGIIYLKTRKEIDPRRIGLIGHSEGGIIAPLIASRRSDVAWIVLLAGPGLRGDEILFLQQELIAKAQGVSDANIALAHGLNAKLYAAASAEKNPANMAADLGAIFEADPLGKQMSAAQRTSGIAQLSSPWFLEFLTYDPTPALIKTKCPVLALNGGNDLQVPPKQDLAAIHKDLQDGGNKDFQTTEMPGLNHLFQHSATGSPSEYETIEETFSPEALEIMTTWVLKHSSM
jgi:pimeloyl-ACP methyl ester carboxylesterase